MRYSVYGTVYNSISTVEESLRSSYSPDYDTVIVDSFSKDGTYEKLLELRKEYNLRLYRLKSTRGRGREYALRHCPEGARTAYVDFDVIYNKNFHGLMHDETDCLWTGVDQQTFYVNRERALRNGGWYDLNAGEVENFLIRNGIRKAVPAIIGFNHVCEQREERYDKGIYNTLREFKNQVDWIRGEAFTISAPYTPKKLLYHMIARLRGVYRYDKNMDNNTMANMQKLEKIENPEDFGIDNEWAAFCYMSTGTSEAYVDAKVFEAMPDSYKFIAYGRLFKEEKALIYVKDPGVMGHMNKMAIFSRWEKPQFVGRLRKIL